MKTDRGALREGTIIRWEQGKGFGFIRPRDGSKDVFVHVTALPNGRPLSVGTDVIFSLTEDPKGRGMRALKAVPAAGKPGSVNKTMVEQQIEHPPQHARRNRLGSRPREENAEHRSTRTDSRRRDQSLRAIPINAQSVFVGFLALFCLTGAVIMIPVTPIPLIAYPLMSLIAFFAYARDKLSAIRNTWRIPESSLHLLEALGGWPGAYLAQKSMRHKTVKTSYQITYWLIVCLHVAFWATWLIAPEMLISVLKSTAEISWSN
ncbi:cold shock and DUF1294 domain-containing protein [Thiorhodovibrio frisius]|uniref:Putative membrane protein n=1 Tax=Thiorhodovibrio frisius TaxID=631362 RepID=H8YYI7_9GAMM|nr:cold shock and DUF1294 domain-containing protein [Thiorhodovibrio frisius]EIC23513.1 putative membrane protein [Thiorhodovibrio frisius]WPL23400.1 Cold shock-like protein CspJ [Thiorhodovibrio frisius]